MPERDKLSDDMRDRLEQMNQDMKSSDRIVSQEYQEYMEAEKERYATRYERLAKKTGSITKIDLTNIPLVSTEDLQKSMRIARINLTQQEVGSLLFIPLSVLLLLSVILTIFLPSPFQYFVWIAPLFWAYWVVSYPGFKATVVKIKSADEALRIILYMAMHLDMQPSLEGAVKDAANHSSGPVSRDLAKILWDVETNKYPTILEGVSTQMKLWREWSTEYVKSFEFLIDSVSRLEGRKRMIQKAQDNMIESTKEKMQDFAHDLSTPVKIVNMIGIVLPLMGLIMFPLVSIFLNQGQNSVGGLTFSLAFGYVVVLPSILFFLVKRMISKRPGAYSHPSLDHVRNLPPKDKIRIDIGGKTLEAPVKPVSAGIALIIMSPGLIYYFQLIRIMLAFQTGLSTGQAGATDASSGVGVVAGEQWAKFIKQQYKIENLLPNVIQGMTVFWGTCAGFITYFLGRSYRRMKVRRQIERIEEGLDVGLTELENALSKGQPIERAVYDVVDEFEKIGEGNHPLHDFFGEVTNRIEGLGLPFKQAIFDENQGAIHYYPSNLLRNTMQVIANSANQGTKIMSQNIQTVNEYIANQKRVENLIDQLLSETVSQMKMLSRFIAPIITSAAATMSFLIVEVLHKIAQRLKEVEQAFDMGSVSGGGGITDQIALIKNVDQAIPPTILLLIVSTYLVEVSLILSYFTNGIENGFDEINRDMNAAKTLIYAVIIFTLIVIAASNFMAPFIQNQL
jgi:hypothetical protein